MTKYIFTGIIFFLIFNSYIIAEPREWKSNPFSKAFLAIDGGADATRGLLTQSSIYSGLSAQGFKLQGIWKSATNYKAMINDNILTVGQEYNGYRVKSIVANKVVLQAIESGVSLNLEIKE